MEYRARGIRKGFGGILALKGVDFVARPRSVHALIGENGAGKSTLLKVLAGAISPDEGSLEVDGRVVEFGSTAEALTEGIAIVSQELSLFPDIDLIGNLFPLGPPTKLGLVDRNEAERRSRQVLDELGVRHPLRTPVGELSLAEQQLIEIARAVITNPRVLILDEPTSALDREDVGHVHHVLEVLRQRNVAVVYVSHILEDVIDHVDEVTVLRDGQVVVAAAPSDSLTMSQMITAMVGRSIDARRPRPRRQAVSGTPLTVTDLCVGAADRITLAIAPGEIVGLAGLAGAGHHDVFDAIAGITPARSGAVELPSGTTNPRAVRATVREGVAIVPGDRKKLGLHLDAPIWENIAAVRSFTLSSAAGLVRRGPLLDRASRRIDQFGIAADATTPTANLSGGNQQKVVFAKWAEADASVILMDDPTRGIDVGGRTEVWDLIDELSDSGAIQLVLSSDLRELASICHRVLVFREGRIAAELAGDQITHASLLEAMNRELVTT